MDLAFVYVDMGDEFYKFATHKMAQSARDSIPGIRIVQLTDSRTAHYPDADLVLAGDEVVENICAFKGKAMAEYAMVADRPVIFSDVDIIWRGAPEMPASGVSLMERDGFPSMPVNTGVILSASDEAAKGWWRRYAEVVADLERNGMGGWYADQIAAAICLRQPGWSGMDMNAVCPTPENDNTTSPAIHFKGPRKGLMLA